MFSVKSMRQSAVAVGGAIVLLASGASAAHATPTFSPTGAVVWKASTTNPITMKIAGGTQPWHNRTCVQGATAGTGSVSMTQITALALPVGSLTCTDGTGATFQTTITMVGQAGFTNINNGTYVTTVNGGLNINDVGAPAGTGIVSNSPGFPFPAQFINGTTSINGANPSSLKITQGQVVPVGHVREAHNPSVVVPIFLNGSFIVGTATAPVNISGS